MTWKNEPCKKWIIPFIKWGVDSKNLDVLLLDLNHIMEAEYSDSDKIYKVTNKKIAELKPRLLDLTLRNPLLSTKFSPRSNSLIRIVDVLSDILAFKLRQPKGMQIVPLPEVYKEPIDEKTPEFRSAFATERQTNEIYLRELKKAQDENIEQEVTFFIERKLKDKVRKQLRLPPLNWEEHVLSHNISFSYDLPDSQQSELTGVDEIKTLLFPNDLERKLKAIITKSRTLEQETGINVLYAAFGFLEWFESNNYNKPIFAPLLLLPVKLEKRKTEHGIQFYIQAEGNDIAINYVLAERLKNDFGIILPEFKPEQENPNDYFKYLSNSFKKYPDWRVRRQVAIGIFPTSRMALHDDLDKNANLFSRHPVVAKLLGGEFHSFNSGRVPNDTSSGKNPSEPPITGLVLDADGSQYATIKAALLGKNLAVEGPPGTGKSQTIVNIIAAAMAQGKKVLFVAEKMAALEVVKSRLEAAGLGEFLLPLQVTRSTREQVVTSIRERIMMDSPQTPSEYSFKIDQRQRIKKKIEHYIDILSSKFSETNLSFHDILGKTLRTRNILEDLRHNIHYPIENLNLSYQKRSELDEAAITLSDAWGKAKNQQTFWVGLNRQGQKLNYFDVLDLQNLTRDIVKSCQKIDQAEKSLKKLLKSSNSKDFVFLAKYHHEYCIFAQMSQLCKMGKELAQKREMLRNFIVPLAKVTTADLYDFSELLESSKFLNRFSSRFREAKRTYQQACVTKRRFKTQNAASAFKELAEWRQGREAFLKSVQTNGLFSIPFKEEDTNFESFEKLIELCKNIINKLYNHHLDDPSISNFYKSLLLEILQSPKRNDVISILEDILQHKAKIDNDLKKLNDKSSIVFTDRLHGKFYPEIAQFFVEASKDEEGMHTHAALSNARSKIEELGFGWLVDFLEEKQLSFENLNKIIQALLFQELARKIYEKHGPLLSQYSDTTLNELREEFSQLDKDIVQLAQKEIRAKIYHTANPPQGIGYGKKSEWSESSLLESEIAKKKRFIPVRDLTRRAGKALLQLKPCWMMSPLSVAQYLPQGSIDFDLCILDEASQMSPENAIGTLARAKQAVIVGDTNQLPPTNFFKKILDEDDIDEDTSVSEESILEIANLMFRPARKLRWHYRSRHSSLIQFSNHYVYEDSLIVFPSPSENRQDMGVSLFHVQNGYYHAGINPEEAHLMTEKILQFMHENPDRSLGVVTLNQKQRDLLLEELDREIDQDPIASDYVTKWEEENDGLASFFVKNLENVQGDERDVIFIGTTYGPEAPGGKVMQRFGPINGITGKRRLNVLFSRARKQIITFSSMTAADIQADENGNPGAYMLKCWLEYAATGKIHQGSYTGKGPDSDFEIYVMDQLKSMGCEPVPQVGVSGYYIDIGVKHPDWEYGFILGIECDGARYHSHKSARERDRLREEVLKGLGWKLHRIWSTSWFNRPSYEVERLRRAIKERLDELKKDYVSSQSKHVARDNALPKEPDTPQRIKPVSLQKNFIEIGDTAEICYLSDPQNVKKIVITLSDDTTKSNIEKGIIHINTPLGKALYEEEPEEGEEIEFLTGKSIQKIRIEKIFKKIRQL